MAAWSHEAVDACIGSGRFLARFAQYDKKCRLHKPESDSPAFDDLKLKSRASLEDSETDCPTQAPKLPIESLEGVLVSAEEVLRGIPVTGAFSFIPEIGLRRRLACELMGDGGDCDDGWRRAFIRNMPQTKSGTWRFLESALLFPEPPGFRRFIEHERVPRCWTRFLEAWSPASSQFRFRQQAAAAFPFLVALAVQTAYSEERWPRVQSAWAVIDAIDRGLPLVPALANFLQLGRGAIRAGRRIPEMPWNVECTWSGVRRLLRTIVGLPLPARPRSHPEWTHAALTLPWASLVARHARQRVAKMPATTPYSSESMRYLRHSSPAELLRKVRADANVLFTGPGNELAERLHGCEPVRVGEPCTPDDELRIRIQLKARNGWTLASIVSMAELAREGEEMNHCVAEVHAEDLVAGTAEFFSMRSNRNKQRLTLKIDRCPHSESLQVLIAGPGNLPIRISALSAAVSMVGTLWPRTKIDLLQVN